MTDKKCPCGGNIKFATGIGEYCDKGFKCSDGVKFKNEHITVAQYKAQAIEKIRGMKKHPKLMPDNEEEREAFYNHNQLADDIIKILEE